ncbi:MAG: peptide transporter substrate-binding protein [Microvirga sp.]|jgi:peptide/nickel transport system substrate-binding protein|nr:peptide transporter substrate-binding protein [Microvirga sp.]
MKDKDLYERIRGSSTELQNHVIDEYRNGGLSRRGFVRMASIMGLSIPAVNLIAGIAPSAAQTSGGGRGGILRVGSGVPGQQLDPILIQDGAGTLAVTQVGEYLSWSEPGRLRPVLAESWTPNDKGTIWTFKIRRGVKFNNGRSMTARDVAWTFNRLANPKFPSSASGMFSNTLVAGGVSAPDDTTVVFELEKPVGSFSWLVSNDNYNAVIVPENYEGVWAKDWVGTGPWRIKEYIPGVRAIFVPNPDYWQGTPSADSVELTMFEDEKALLLAFQNQSIDITGSVGLANARSVLRDQSRYKVDVRKTSVHDPIHFRMDSEPFKDKRVRQAMAFCIDRKSLVEKLLQGYASIGNDAPIAPVHEVFSAEVPQRPYDLNAAKRLLEEAGYSKGFQFKMTVLNYQVLPQMAQLLQSSLKQINVDVQLELLDSATYRGDLKYGSSPMLDSISGVNNYGHRGVPNLFFNIQLKTGANINSARFSSKEFDTLADQFAAEVDLQKQRAITKKIHNLLLDETPMIYPAFKDQISLSQTSIQGLQRQASHPVLHTAIKRA